MKSILAFLVSGAGLYTYFSYEKSRAQEQVKAKQRIQDESSECNPTYYDVLYLLTINYILHSKPDDRWSVDPFHSLITMAFLSLTWVSEGNGSSYTLVIHFAQTYVQKSWRRWPK